jgi:hypothetical protein
MITANWFAYIALFGWPLVALLFFILMPLEKAAACSLVGGYLLLPSGLQINPPGLPPMDKTSLTVMSTLLLCLAKGAPRTRGSTGYLIPALAAAYVIAPTLATFNNSYELQYGNLSVPGFYLVDGLKGSVLNLIQLGSFYIGSRYFSSLEARIELLRIFVTAMLGYTLLMLVELKISPQLHRLVYGYSPFGFINEVRGSGYRPVVFFPQGLQLALFVVMAFIAACTLARHRVKILGMPRWVPPAYLSLFVLLCKSLGAYFYALVLAPSAVFARPSTSVKIATVLMVLACVYPALRTQNLSPVESAMAAAQRISATRAESLETRLKNENRLLAKANEKPFFGWGQWGRNRVYNAQSSMDVSITDGGWIIYYGVYGWWGYIAMFGLLTVPVLRLNRSVRHAAKEDATVAAGLSLMLAANLLDMIPNDNLTLLTLLIAGSISHGSLSVAAAKLPQTRRRREMAASPPRPRPVAAA